MADVVIIGAGRLGTTLGRALAEAGHTIAALTCRRGSSARESRRIIGSGRVFADNAPAAEKGNLIFLCLPDEEIIKEASALARSRSDWTDKNVYHTSGLLASAVLKPLQDRGAAVASFHPVQSFPRKDLPPAHFKGVYFGLEGGRRALVPARKIVRRLGGRALVIPAEAKPLYHAACSIASNFLVVLLDAAAQLLVRAGIEEQTASRLLFPLVEGTLQNVKNLDTTASLTGPVARGETAAVRAHIEALRFSSGICRAYKKIGLVGLEIAARKGLPPEKLRALKNLLEDKSPLPQG
jgi:predicted short-subunit dehydrogenase-like oxidoreductase (DUF2520 family)